MKPKQKSVLDIKYPVLQVKIDDYLTRKHTFYDSEICGWVIVKKDDGPKVYYMYQRLFDDEVESGYRNEPCIHLGEELKGEELEKEVQKLLSEIETQKNIGKIEDSIQTIKSFLLG